MGLDGGEWTSHKKWVLQAQGSTTVSSLPVSNKYNSSDGWIAGEEGTDHY